MLYYFIVRLCFSLHVFGTFAVLTLAGGEELDEFGAVGKEGIKCGRGLDEFAVAENCLRNGGEQIHAQILSLSTVQKPVLCLSIQTRGKSRPSMDGI